VCRSVELRTHVVLLIKLTFLLGFALSLNQMSIKALIVEFTFVIKFWLRKPKSGMPLIPGFPNNGSHTVL
jgi:hypothetical protein